VREWRNTKREINRDEERDTTIIKGEIERKRDIEQQRKEGERKVT